MSSYPTPHDSATLLMEAVRYAEAGLTVVPLRINRIGSSKRVQPLVKWRSLREPPSSDVLADHFSRPGVNGIGMVCGNASGGISARDFDTEASYHAWAGQHPVLAGTLPTTVTGRGRHVLFRGASGYVKLNDGELIANNRHLLILPPSWHPVVKRAYAWLNPLTYPVPVVDPIASGLLPPRQHVPPHHATQHHSTAWIACITQAFRSPIEHAVRDTVPTGPGQRNRKLFDLAQLLKFIPGYVPKAQELKAIVRGWLELAIRAGTKDTDFERSWEDFTTAWLNVKHPRGGILRKAAAKARTIANDLDGRILELCRNLAGKDGSFYLSYASAARELGLGENAGMIIYRRMAVLQVEGKVELIQRGERRKGGLASRWRLIGNPAEE